jgi:hypothetical protein
MPGPRHYGDGRLPTAITRCPHMTQRAPPAGSGHALSETASLPNKGEGEGVKGRSRLACARSAALEALALT